MAVIRVQKTEDYTIMSNTHFREKGMSLKAKGLLSLMLSLPDSWDYSVEGLVAICKENKTSIQSTLKELKAFGYLQVQKLMPNETATGRIEYIYNIYEKPQIEKQAVEKQGIENLPLENLGVENQVVDNQPQLNTNISSTKEVKTKKENTKNKAVYFPNDERLNQAFADFVEYRKKIRKPMTDRAIELAIAKLHDLANDNDTMIEIINQSVMRGWSGFFPLKDTVKRTTSNKLDESYNMIAKWAEG